MTRNPIDDIYTVFDDNIADARESGDPVNDAAVSRLVDYLDDVANGDDDIDIDYLKELARKVLDIE